MSVNDDLMRNTITVRGKQYTVTELDGQTMRDIQKILETEKGRLGVYTMWKCCIDPVFKTEEDVMKLPYYVIDKVSDEAWRLQKISEPEQKKD